MAPRRFSPRFRELFSGRLAALGFDERRNLRFVRSAGNSQQIIQFRDRFEYITKRFRFDFVLAVHLRAVEEVWRPEQAAELPATVALPIHLLRPDGVMDEWYLDDPGCVADVMAQIRRYGLPFLERYSDIAAVKARLESDAAKDWFMLNAERRLCTLAAIEVVEGHRERAIAMLDAALAEREGMRPVKWWELKELRDRLLTH